MKTNKEIVELLTASTQLTEIPSDGNMYYGIYDDVVAANTAAIRRIAKPQDWSLLYDGKKFMIARDKNVKEIMQKYKSWKLVGAYDSEAFIKKKLIDVNNLSKNHKAKASKDLAQLLSMETTRLAAPATWTPADVKDLKRGTSDLEMASRRLDSLFFHTKNKDAQAIMEELDVEIKKVKDYVLSTYK